jgi:hypothetical protein
MPPNGCPSHIPSQGWTRGDWIGNGKLTY